MKTPLGTEVELGAGHIVLDGVPGRPKGAQQPPPLFSAHVYCGHGRPSQLLLSACLFCHVFNAFKIIISTFFYIYEELHSIQYACSSSIFSVFF